MDQLLQTLAGLDTWVVYAVIGALVCGESAAVVALIMPGELTLLAAGALVATGHLSLPVVLLVTASAAVVGHAAGYELGRRFGLRLLRWRPLRRYADAVVDMAGLVVRHGGMAVFLGRWTNVGRIIVPLLVGAGRMPYRSFATYNVLGGVAWVSVFVVAGRVAGASAGAVQRATAQVSWWVVALVVVAAVVGWVWRRVERRRHAPDHASDEGDGGHAARCTVQAASSSEPDLDP